MITAIKTSKDKPVVATPSAVPAAGGCSISITTIVNIAAPTAHEYITMENIKSG